MTFKKDLDKAYWKEISGHRKKKGLTIFQREKLVHLQNIRNENDTTPLGSSTGSQVTEEQL